MKVGLIGLGAMGRVHFDCWRKSTAGQLVAISDRDAKKLAGDWAGREFNLGDQAAGLVDLSDLAAYRRAEDLIADPQVELVDICMPTLLHAPLAIAALRAGKHVFCEKPMSLTSDACIAMETAARESGRHLTIGHCLRFWPQYVKAKELLDSGEFGRAIYANFFRFSLAPLWSDSDWYMKRTESGGVFDMHIHDVDVGLWWFGKPDSVRASGVQSNGLPMIIDAAWQYRDGPVVQMHASWDRHGGTFRHAFQLIMEKGSLVHDLATDPNGLQLLRGGKATSIPVANDSAYQAELDYFAGQLDAGQTPTRVTPAEGQLAVEIGLEELRQLDA
jgi:predicted dehydrogenase